MRSVIERCWAETMRRKAALALMLVVAAATASCDGETEDDDDGPSGPVAVNDFSQRFAASYCASIQGCCERFGERFELSSCQETLRAYLAAALGVQLANPKIIFDEQVAGQCIDAYAAVARACTERSNAADDACDGLLRGTVPVGGECGESDECVQTAEQDASCTSGICVAEEPYESVFDGPHAALGEACAGTCEGDPDTGGGSCSGIVDGVPGTGVCWLNDGLICSTAGSCVAAPQVGEPCQQYQCAVGAYCVASTCEAASSDGPCTSDSACLPTSYCDYDAMRCIPLKADGETCDSGDECLGGDCEADRCREWSVASAESCSGLLDD